MCQSNLFHAFVLIKKRQKKDEMEKILQLLAIITF